MGAVFSKGTPHWKSEEDVLCAYLYEEHALKRSKKFILRGCKAGDDDHEWNAATNATVRNLIEEEIFNPHGQPVEIAADVPKARFGYKMFEAAVARLEKEWSPKMNQKIEPHGYMVEGFGWVEHVYMSQGQYGGYTKRVPHFCIRVKKLPAKDEG